MAHPSVRLTLLEQNLILKAVKDVCANENLIWNEICLFGSRTDVNKRGGDIDLLIRFSNEISDVRKLVNLLRQKLEDLLGEQKFDILIDFKEVKEKSKFIELINDEAVVLWKNETKN